MTFGTMVNFYIAEPNIFVFLLTYLRKCVICHGTRWKLHKVEDKELVDFKFDSIKESQDSDEDAGSETTP